MTGDQMCACGPAASCTAKLDCAGEVRLLCVMLVTDARWQRAAGRGLYSYVGGFLIDQL